MKKMRKCSANQKKRLDINEAQHQSIAGCENTAPQLADDCAKAKSRRLMSSSSHGVSPPSEISGNKKHT